MDGPERAAIRQVAHEVLKTLKQGYSKRPQHNENNAGMTVFGGAVFEIEDNIEEYLPAGNASAQPNNGGSVYAGIRPKKMGRNERCWCGSGRKFKHCHGKMR
jgi:uncharacterized protein YchJ